MIIFMEEFSLSPGPRLLVMNVEPAHISGTSGVTVAVPSHSPVLVTVTLIHIKDSALASTESVELMTNWGVHPELSWESAVCARKMNARMERAGKANLDFCIIGSGFRY
jgi:hypothetical protein